MKIIDVENELRRMSSILGSTIEGRVTALAADIVHEHGQWQHEQKQLCPSFAHFGEAVWRYITRQGNDFCDEEISEDILPLAQAAGLCSRVLYDPAIHGEGIEAAPGDEIWHWLSP